jgi:tRNA (adenine37-N6)-methyltransferase
MMSDMQTEEIVYKPIGYVRSPHADPKLTPIQPCYSEDTEGSIKILIEYEDGLTDIEGFSHIIVIYHFNQAGPPMLKVRPFLEDKEHGVFATRHPSRHNPIGMSILRLLKRDGSTLHVSGVDMLDGTPVLDIKPYVKRFDFVKADEGGWHDSVPEETAQKLGRRSEKMK